MSKYARWGWRLLVPILFISLVILISENNLKSFEVELVSPTMTGITTEPVGDAMGSLPDGKYIVRFKIIGDPSQKIYTYYVTKSHLTIISYMNKRVGDRMHFDFRMTKDGKPDYPWRETR